MLDPYLRSLESMKGWDLTKVMHLAAEGTAIMLGKTTFLRGRGLPEQKFILLVYGVEFLVMPLETLPGIVEWGEYQLGRRVQE